MSNFLYHFVEILILGHSFPNGGPGASGFGGGGFRPGDHSYGYGPSCGPSYPSYSSFFIFIFIFILEAFFAEFPESGGGGGFWNGLATGGLLGYLWNRPSNMGLGSYGGYNSYGSRFGGIGFSLFHLLLRFQIIIFLGRWVEGCLLQALQCFLGLVALQDLVVLKGDNNIQMERKTYSHSLYFTG